jgi:four helix bundle protein
LARHFPEYEQNGLADQLRRAGYRVPINIAEGSARKGSKDYRRSLETARSSLAEAQTILGIARELGYIHRDDFARAEALATDTSKTLYGLLRKVAAAGKRSSR